MSRLRLASMFMGVCSLALGLIGPASAGTRISSKYGGVLVVGIVSGDPAALDPTFNGALSAIEIYNSFCERLYDFDSKSRIVPQLAAALPVVSKDKLTYTIPLRHGVMFNDGTPFNAQAVVTTLQRDLGSGELTEVDGVTASGPYTVVIHLKTQFTPLTSTFATQQGIVMSPTQLAKLGNNFGTDPICVGAFMYDHRVPGDNITVIKSPYYYNQGAVHLDKIVYKPIPDAPTAAAALRAGDIQVVDNLSPSDLPDIQQSSSLRVLHANGLGWRGIFINLGNKNGEGSPPYANVGTPLASSPLLRQAFEEAIDRSALNSIVFAGTTQPGCTPLSPASPMYDPTIKCTQFDPADARKLVARSGFSNPTVHFLAAATTDMLLLAQFIQAEEAAVGINVVIDQADNATVNSPAASGNFDTLLSGPAGNGDTNHILFNYFATSGESNATGYSNPQLDEILANTHKAISPKALKTLYHAAEEILAADRPVIFLYHSVRYAAFSSSVTGVQLRPDLILQVKFAQYK
jgi:peptide/nickel transport system substrate-binding protein